MALARSATIFLLARRCSISSDSSRRGPGGASGSSASPTTNAPMPGSSRTQSRFDPRTDVVGVGVADEEAGFGGGEAVEPESEGVFPPAFDASMLVPQFL